MTGSTSRRSDLLTKLQISVIKARCARVCILHRRIAVLADVRYISCVLAFAILFMYAEPPPPPPDTFSLLGVFLLRMCIPVCVVCVYTRSREKKTAGLTRGRKGERGDINPSFPSNERERERRSGGGIDLARDFKDWE